jgi:hypothetical protein
VVPALRALGCATSACHQGEPAARALLDLASLGGKSNTHDAAFASFEKEVASRVVPWKSPVVMAAWGEGARVHKKVDVASCAYRELHAFVARAPEIHCDRASDASARHRLDELAVTVMPALLKRGCGAPSCHGGGAGGMSLFDPMNDPHAAAHDDVVLTARIEAGESLDRSTLLRKARNVDPHGGGRRLGGEGDCVDAMLVDWAMGQKLRACASHAVPSFDRFVAEVQPVLERMTCTRLACHGGGRRVYRVEPHPDATGLASNYKETLAQINPDFAPLSEVMLRMREPCAYAVTAAWIEGAAKPDCVMNDPDPAIFPRLDDPGAMHP